LCFYVSLTRCTLPLSLCLFYTPGIGIGIGLVVDMTTILNSIPLENLEEVSASIKDHVDSYTRKPSL
jgi:hypothetical protein